MQVPLCTPFVDLHTSRWYSTLCQTFCDKGWSIFAIAWRILFELSFEFSLNSYHTFRWTELQHTKHFFRLSRHLTSELYSSGKSWNYFLRMRAINFFLGCRLQWFAFNFCVPVTFLPINLCSHSVNQIFQTTTKDKELWTYFILILFLLV
jgi:hypothetical protein